MNTDHYFRGLAHELRTRYRCSCFRLVSNRFENGSGPGVVDATLCDDSRRSARIKEGRERSRGRTLHDVIPKRPSHTRLLRDKLAQLLLR
jgi:hypothetical protein